MRCDVSFSGVGRQRVTDSEWRRIRQIVSLKFFVFPFYFSEGPLSFHAAMGNKADSRDTGSIDSSVSCYKYRGDVEIGVWISSFAPLIFAIPHKPRPNSSDDIDFDRLDS